ncbi:hypothetical protein [Brevibacillus choshinensis]|uniref:hypothetical protein n=1 Tax=Brevibacillus choshinensis TaxID=54911 RepID=UPI002E239630|nr:hypothetical protein [Brevibacillus choshinensis]
MYEGNITAPDQHFGKNPLQPTKNEPSSSREQIQGVYNFRGPSHEGTRLVPFKFDTTGLEVRTDGKVDGEQVENSTYDIAGQTGRRHCLCNQWRKIAEDNQAVNAIRIDTVKGNWKAPFTIDQR